MSNEKNSFWRNVATGIGVAAAGAALAYFVSEIIPDEAELESSSRNTNQPRPNPSNPSASCRNANHPRQNQNNSAALKSQTLRQSLTDKLNSGTGECSICLEDISRSHKIISCTTCYGMFHLQCLSQHFFVSQENSKCPLCREPMDNDLEYRCFCQRMLNPRPKRGEIPHTCGARCPKCPLLCHPGPCDR